MPEPSSDLCKPPAPVLRWITDAVGPGCTVRSVRLLAGATSSTLHSIQVTYKGHDLALVLRRFTNRQWLEQEPDLALHEAASLRKASQAGLPAPGLVASDPGGAHCDVPAILMTHLPGSVELAPRDLDAWLYRLAEALIPLHAVEVGTHRWRYAPYNDVSGLDPPRWSGVRGLWEKAIEIVTGPRPEARECFIHRDYHPTNVLWQDSEISGIVDWPNACRGPAGIDVAWCRGNLVYLHGVAAADRFLHHYRSLSGAAFEYHPFWDLMVIIEALPGPPSVYPPWLAFGVHHVNQAVMQQRVDEYLASVMARF